MTLVLAKQKKGANFVRMNANPTPATKARPIAIAVTTIAVRRIRRIATALKSASPAAMGNFYRDRLAGFSERSRILRQELARAMLTSVDTS